MNFLTEKKPQLYFLAVIVLILVNWSEVDGLECYECLSLTCPTPSLCTSIRHTMTSTFAPSAPGHVIHFNPNDPCPESEPPTDNSNSSAWSRLTMECQRSDSFCLVSPLEVLSPVSGSLDGSKLPPDAQLTSKGYIRGCASRRKLAENEPTIKVSVDVVEQPRPDDELEAIHGHVFYIEQGTVNVTKCIADRCNTKIKFKSGASGLVNNFSFGSTLMLLASLIFVSN